MKNSPTCLPPQILSERPPRSAWTKRHQRDARSRAALFTGLWIVCAALSAAPPLTVQIAFIGPPASDAHAGADQGIREANAQGKFLGLSYTLVDVPDVSAALAAQVSAIVVADTARDLPALAVQATGTPVLNVSAEDDRLRAHCINNLFHTIPSQTMRADALKQWQQKQAHSHAQARAWHNSAELYAGAQLNKRYAEQSGRAMNDQAWAAWAAVKLLADTIARLHSSERAGLLTALHHELAFDGQKGVDMDFRDNGQLRQPLLLIEDNKIVGEAPVRGIVANGDLDSLGATSCPK